MFAEGCKNSFRFVSHIFFKKRSTYITLYLLRRILARRNPCILTELLTLSLLYSEFQLTVSLMWFGLVEGMYVPAAFCSVYISCNCKLWDNQFCMWFFCLFVFYFFVNFYNFIKCNTCLKSLSTWDWIEYINNSISIGRIHQLISLPADFSRVNPAQLQQGCTPYLMDDIFFFFLVLL